MAVWFLRGIRRGVVTTRYPRTPPDPWIRDLAGPPVFQPDRLTRHIADELVDICPSRALRRNDGELVVDLGACTWCGLCFGTAVRPSHEIELAATSRENLIKTIPIRGDQP
jgi:formate hydrogenlyase subunit 6/NADH:ubiquinone oxidoreductase subunit I